jgi:hypothetical protein
MFTKMRPAATLLLLLVTACTEEPEMAGGDLETPPILPQADCSARCEEKVDECAAGRPLPPEVPNKQSSTDTVMSKLSSGIDVEAELRPIGGVKKYRYTFRLKKSGTRVAVTNIVKIP